MLGHQEHEHQQIVPILSTSSERQQKNYQGNFHGEKELNMIMPATATATTLTRETMNQKLNQDQIQLQQQQQQQLQQQPSLRCPRCDSANTKFCYFNNYSLSQPRHFCKACKRYWTRGGTLRNVPVGGGCRRKHKRVSNKRPFSSSPSSSSSNPTTLASSSCGGAVVNPNYGSSHLVNNSPLLYGLPTNFPSAGDATIPFSYMNPSNLMSGGLDLGFLTSSNNYNQKMYGISTNPKQILQDLISSNPNSSIISTFGSCPPSSSSNLSFLSRNLPPQQHHKLNFQAMFPYEDLVQKIKNQQGGGGGVVGGVLQYQNEDDDDGNEDQEGGGEDDDDADPVKMKLHMSHSGSYHEYTNLNNHHSHPDDQHHHQPVVVTSSPHTSMSWNNHHQNNSGGNGTTAHHLGPNNNWLDPTYSSSIGSTIQSLI